MGSLPSVIHDARDRFAGERPAGERPASERTADDRGARGHAIETRVRASLRESAYFDVRSVECEFDAGVLTLHGTVPSYYLKQIAQYLAGENVGDSVVIDNRLTVSTPAAP